MAEHARGTFAVTLLPEESGLPMVGRFALQKTYTGEAIGTGAGTGAFALQQLGTISGGNQQITYVVTPGSGTGDLAGNSGRLDLEIRDGQHHYDLVYELPDV